MSSIADAGAAAGLAAGVIGTASGSWRNRLREAAYTSPKGTRIKFDYFDLSRDYTKRGTVFEFPGVDGGYVQPHGFGPRRYPMRIVFSGPKCDLFALAFEAALLEPGIGKLEHPIYGKVPKVIPFGDITRRDDLVTAANQVVIEVTFWTTLGAVYPSSSTDPQSEILAALGAFDVAAAQQFANSTNLRGALRKAQAISSFKKFLRDTSRALTKASQSVSKVRRQFADIQGEVNGAIDILIGQPVLLAQQCVNLVKAPARAMGAINDRLDGYQALLDSVFASAQATPGETLASGIGLAQRTTRITNDLHISDLFALSAVAGSAVAVVAQPIAEDGSVSPDPQFLTKPDALGAASALMLQFDELVAWRDEGFTALQQIPLEAMEPSSGNGLIDTGEAYQALQQAVALTAGFLIQVSFTLAAERRIVLDRNRTIIDLAAELYGSVDDRLDFLINTNNLSGDRILELQRGDTILYYPQ